MKTPKFFHSILFRYRFYIGQATFVLIFCLLLTITYFNAQHLISPAEMTSAVNSTALSLRGMFTGDFVDLPFRLLQTISIRIFGLTAFAIKLPSIIIGVLSGAILAVLINRWHKTNVSIITSIIIVPTAFFLSIATTGSPAIMLIFYPALLLWLGSKVIARGATPSPLDYFLFVITLALACYTPYLLYINIVLIFICIVHPRIRMHIKTFAKIKFILVSSVYILFLSPIIVSIFTNSAPIHHLFFPEGFSIYNSFRNLVDAVTTLTNFSQAGSYPIITPALGLAITVIAIIGFTTIFPKRTTSRYQTIMAFFALALITTALDVNYIVLFFVPIAILVANGIEFILTEWYSLFPENPYARLFGGFLITVFATLIVTSNVYFTTYSVHHAISVAESHTSTLDSLLDYIDDGGATIITNDETLDFYKILERHHPVSVTSDTEAALAGTTISIGSPLDREDVALQNIVTSPRYQNADLFYMYAYAPAEEEEEPESVL